MKRMTRKTRTRRPRISALQSGYCAVCNIPYNSVEDHIQSKKHQKLIGEDANYIALNGSLNGFLQTNSIPFLNLNGIDAIGVHDSSFDEFSPTYRKRAMRRNRAASVMCDRPIPASPLSPASSDITGHHLRSRRNINYMTPPLEDDGLNEKLDLAEHEQENKDSRELRATTRSLTKLMSPISETFQEEVWNSGRPKRTCISKKRLSIDDRLSNCKTYYKVEVITPKLKCNSGKEITKRQQSQSPKRDEEKEKALIVKFKKLRNSELIQLNNEATNFLFPKKDDTSEEEIDEGDCNTTASSLESCSNLEAEDLKSSTPKLINEDETSMDSTGKKKKRRTHAEAFILDNQKYYKFETPGSRLRYQGSYLPPVVTKPPEDIKTEKIEEEINEEEPVEKKAKYDTKVKLDNYKFAFEKIPSKTGWYNAFKRLDNTEQSYAFFSNYLWEALVLPYQMRTIQPLDRKLCYKQYRELLDCLLNYIKTDSESSIPSPEPDRPNSSNSLYDPLDEDSKLSASTSTSVCSSNDKAQNKDTAQVNKGKCSKKTTVPDDVTTSPTSGGKNPRKSPRQHASTLAILSGLINQRKGRTKGKVQEKVPEKSGFDLSTIEEETIVQMQEEAVREPTPPPPAPFLRAQPTPTPNKLKKTPRKNKPKVDYNLIAKEIDQELDTALEDNLDLYDIDISQENTVEFNKSRITLDDILELHENNHLKETEKNCRRLFNGASGRKPGFRRKKLNKTGWPNKSKRPTTKKEQIKEKEEVESNVDSSPGNNNNSSGDEEVDFEAEPYVESESKNEQPKENVPTEKVDKSVSDLNSENSKQSDTQPMQKVINSEILQPYVCVQKLDGRKYGKTVYAPPRRTSKRQRRMPASPKSPRMLRKPRGQWYRER